ncbi:MAG: hypothetical protein ISS41_11425 [Candidatus Aminicenantes bacterium]|nr:hypothetical protein [Candidatus Aminicenantes bacterium]
MTKEKKETAITPEIVTKRDHPLYPERYANGQLKPGMAPVRKKRTMGPRQAYGTVAETFHRLGGKKQFTKWAKQHKNRFYIDIFLRLLPQAVIAQIMLEEEPHERPDEQKITFVQVKTHGDEYIDALAAICMSYGYDIDELETWPGREYRSHKESVRENVGSEKMHVLAPGKRTDEKDGSDKGETEDAQPGREIGDQDFS